MALSNYQTQIIKTLFLSLTVLIILTLSSTPTFAQEFGSITNPLTKISTNNYGDVNTAGGGLVGFISNIVKTVTVFAGIFSMFNFIVAGLDYITSQGDPKGTEAARNKIKQSVIGLVIIVGTLSLTAIASQILFGNFNAILNPTIYGKGSITNP